MREMIRGLVILSLLLALAAFIYVIGFAPLDPDRSPRAAALSAGPNIPRAITSIRAKMAQEQFESAAGQAVDLAEKVPDSPQARLYALLTLHLAGRDAEAMAYGADLVEITDEMLAEGQTLGTTELYLRGWGMRILGIEEDARASFRELAARIESLHEGHPSRNGYNLACYWALAGEEEAALAWWARTVHTGRLSEPDYWRVDPDFEPLHDDPRFWALAQAHLQNPEDVSQLVPYRDDAGVEPLGDTGGGTDAEPASDGP